MELHIHLPDSLAATSDEHEPGDQLERYQSVAWRRLVYVQHQSGIKFLRLINIQCHLTNGGNTDKNYKPSDLRRRKDTFGDRVAEREQQHEHSIQSLRARLEELAQQISVRYRCSSQTEIDVAVNLA